jgi:hypothetical protein
VEAAGSGGGQITWLGGARPGPLGSGPAGAGSVVRSGAGLEKIQELFVEELE